MAEKTCQNACIVFLQYSSIPPKRKRMLIQQKKGWPFTGSFGPFWPKVRRKSRKGIPASWPWGLKKSKESERNGVIKTWEKLEKQIIFRAGSWQNGFFADFSFRAAGFFCGFCRRIFLLLFVGKNPRRNPPKFIYKKNPRPWTERLVNKGLSRQVSRAAWKRRTNRELEAKKEHKPWIREGLNREVQTVN